ncbi:hypothetical protein BKA67DRAFT_660081 [Truncatella angustata]|uniref:Uncharacterized protein n=1 Tax=Truncatella angustata TaxID=152316 RepID=A0A9P8UJS9_9PEZI|nr:uncharacterized protein BKA67DRAFT_660081 [Truncatella angustata]KAH6653469.1 hypothetical protein BKA67DRAFT_660081 [Truncatella angustata]
MATPNEFMDAASDPAYLPAFNAAVKELGYGLHFSMIGACRDLKARGVIVDDSAASRRIPTQDEVDKWHDVLEKHGLEKAGQRLFKNPEEYIKIVQ